MLIKFISETDSVPPYDIFVGDKFIKTISLKNKAMETIDLKDTELPCKVNVLRSKKRMVTAKLSKLLQFIASCIFMVFYWTVTMFDNSKNKPSFGDMVCLFPDFSFDVARQDKDEISVFFKEKKKGKTTYGVPYTKPQNAIKFKTGYNTKFNRMEVVKGFVLFLSLISIVFIPLFAVLILLGISAIQENNYVYLSVLLVVFVLFLFVLLMLIKSDIKDFRTIIGSIKR